MEALYSGLSAKRTFKRKKKKNRFIGNAKGFGKKGIYGRGTHIEDDQFTYFINILDAIKNGFDEVNEKESMANNVFEQTVKKEIHLSSNQIVSKAIESLIGYIDPENLERFFTSFADNFRPICSDRFASHVLQKMVEIAFLRAVGGPLLIEDQENGEVSVEGPSLKKIKADLLSEENYNIQKTFPNEHKTNCRAFVERVSKFLLNNLEDFVWDPCANHIIRTCILSLAGVYVPKVSFKKGETDLAKNKKLFQVPVQWVEIMKEFPARLEMWPQFSDFPYQEHTSALLGCICIALKSVNKHLLKHFGKKVLRECFLKIDYDDKNKIEIIDKEQSQKNIQEEKDIKKTRNQIMLPKVFKLQCSVLLLETLLSLAGPKLLIQLYGMLFAGRVAVLAKGHITNFSVQKLLQHIKEKNDFENIFTELVDEIENLLKIGHTGVVYALSCTCLRLAQKQTQMLVAMQVALHVAGDKEKLKYFFNCLVKLKPYEIVLEDKSKFVHLHGSLIIQQILKFNKPIFLVTCILETPADTLTSVFNTPNGSYISDAFLQSKSIGEKSREKLIRHLEGYYMELAVEKCGSRVIEIFFKVSPDPQKLRIAKELSEKKNLLKGTPFGQIIFNKFRIETFQLSVAQWKGSFNINDKAQSME